MAEDGDSRLHYGIDQGVSKQRSRHDAIIPVDVRTGISGRTIQKCWRVASDWQLRQMLEEERLDKAFDQIKAAYLAIAGGQMARAFDLSEARGRGVGAGSMATTLATYIGWGKAVQQASLSYAMACDVIIFGMTLRETDHVRRQGRGKARKNLIECLKLW